MIPIEKIQALIEDKLSEGDYFIVSLDVSSSNKIKLVVDSVKGITIEECVAFSRAIEHNLDREEEDFELEVTSPGLDHPLKVKDQYIKNVGRELDVLTTDNTKIKGLLQEVKETAIIVKEETKVKVEGKKKKQLQVIEREINFQDINKAFIVIKF
ncbi:MAG: ribosome assembly cofactor RimP [Bacteroidales bacterium]|nr:ribosome assembly cofactor RimP [Bacteroidales bacterium]MBN2817716.1 ribosome assembly cofactor RimP [Bacteroidales bacterium]